MTEKKEWVSVEGAELRLYRWEPEKPAAVLLIAHGMVETAARYRHVAERMTGAGYAVFAHDQRGHGETAGDAEKVGYCGKNGFETMVEDIRVLVDKIRGEYPDLPVFLLGHSYGSFLAQRYISRYGDTLDGVVLSGTNYKQPVPLLAAGRLIAGMAVLCKGPKAKAPLLHTMSFGANIKRVKDPRTPMDWLSRDPEAVDAYLADPFCGCVCSTGFYRDMLRGLSGLCTKRALQRIPKGLPVYIFSGAEDPIGHWGQGPPLLAEAYRREGLTDVTLRMYPEGRHEMLNEINRDEVIGDLLRWLDGHRTERL